MHMTPEHMVIAIGRAFEGVTSYSSAEGVALRNGYNRLVNGCVTEYAVPPVSPRGVL